MKRLVVAAAMVVAALFPALALADADVAPNRFCSVQLVEGGPIYDGVGVTVATPSGQTVVQCRARVPGVGVVVVIF